MSSIPSSLAAASALYFTLRTISSLNRPIGHGAHRFLDLFERKDAIDVGANLPLGQKLRQGVIMRTACSGNFSAQAPAKTLQWNSSSIAAGFIGTEGIWPLVKPIGISRPPHFISRAICSKIVPPTLSKQNRRLLRDRFIGTLRCHHYQRRSSLSGSS